MKNFIVIAFLLVFNSINTFGQKEGDQWVIGYYSSGSPTFSVMNLDFRSGELEVTLRYDLNMFITETASNICNSHGEPIVWTNGMEIFGKNGVRIADTIAYSGGGGVYWDVFYSDFSETPVGFPLLEGAIILPVPNNDDTYSVIYHSAEKRPGILYKVPRFLEARINVKNDSSYTLIYQDSLIGDYHLWYSNRIEAVKHGNGRDWWIVAFEENTGRYYSYILSPTGITLENSAETMPVLSGFASTSSFSPYGNYFARMDSPPEDETIQYLTLYSFNRCTGEFEILETFNSVAGPYSSPSFSPSERYLYGNNSTHLWQWDLWAEDISATQTLVDTFDGFVAPGHFGTYFGPQILAPDGRIYIVPPSGSSSYMHVIDRPDLPAAETNFLQHHIDLVVYNGRSAPNMPNFRLGSLDGSSCDTLGIDNLPVSRWRFEEDEPGLRYDIRFTDLSFYNPEEWHWDFDDGQTSDETSPVHTYESSGIYEVCLTVSNENGSNTKCQEVEILTTALKEAMEKTPDLSIAPNPFSNELNIRSRSGEFRKAHIRLYDMHGRLIFNQSSVPVPLKIVLPSLPSGMYLCKIKEEDGSTYSFKVMKN